MKSSPSTIKEETAVRLDEKVSTDRRSVQRLSVVKLRQCQAANSSYRSLQVSAFS